MIEAVSRVPRQTYETKCSGCLRQITRIYCGYCPSCRAAYMRNWRSERITVKISDVIQRITDELRAIG